MSARPPLASFHPTDHSQARASGRPPASSEQPLVLADPVMLELDQLTTAVAAGDISVLITGETGTGKELFAEAVHQRSPRAGHPFVRINCAALSEALLESELFGHEPVPQTDARPGLLEAAQGGTILLDEVAEMPPALQAKLLRVFEAGEVRRVGDDQSRALDVRVVSATNRDLEAEVGRGRFRADLYYRLAGAVIALPPLRQRPVEIEPLARLFLAAGARRSARTIPRLGTAALERLHRHPWPGNVRELRNMIERALLLCADQEIRPEHLAFSGPGGRPSAAGEPSPADASWTEAPASDEPLTQTSDERQRIIEALRRCAGNQTRAARLLRISRGTLVSRLDVYNLPRPRPRRGDPSGNA